LGFLFIIILLASVLTLAYAVTAKIQKLVDTEESKSFNTITTVTDASGNTLNWKNYGSWS
jgi:hypothetical protein